MNNIFKNIELSLPEKSVDEILPKHWNIDGSKENFNHLLNNIYITTNFCKFFFESIDQDLFSPKAIFETPALDQCFFSML